MPSFLAQLIVLALALTLDLLLGDPPKCSHPVAWMARLIGWVELMEVDDAFQARAQLLRRGTLVRDCECRHASPGGKSPLDRRLAQSLGGRGWP